MALPGSPGERDEICSSGVEGGRRRAIGVVADPLINHPSDRADGATLGRQRRTRRPGLPEIMVSGLLAGGGAGAAVGESGSRHRSFTAKIAMNAKNIAEDVAKVTHPVISSQWKKGRQPGE